VVPDESLMALRHDLTAELEAARHALSELRRQRTGRVDDDEHDPEGSPLSAQWMRLDGLRRAAERRIDEVNAALANAQAGRYGLCLRCGRPIAPGRLEARPTATQCVTCTN